MWLATASQAAPACPAPRICYRKLARRILIGVFAWLVAALSAHAMVSHGLFSTGLRPITFALSIPVAWGIASLLSLNRRDGLATVVVATIAATFCDAIALGWFPAIYSRDPRLTVQAAAWIFWGVAWILGLAAARQRHHSDC